MHNSHLLLWEMRNRTIIGIAAFYLLLSTGMFTCILGCGTQSVVRLFTFVPSQERHHSDQQHDHESKKECKGTADCPCCKKHKNFRVKVNIKPDLQPEVPQVPLISYLPKVRSLHLEPEILGGYNENSIKHPPPLQTSKGLFILYRTILI